MGGGPWEDRSGSRLGGAGAPRAGPGVPDQLPRTLISRLPSSSRDQDAWLNVRSFAHSRTQLPSHTRGRWRLNGLDFTGVAGPATSRRLLAQYVLASSGTPWIWREVGRIEVRLRGPRLPDASHSPQPGRDPLMLRSDYSIL